MESSIGKGGEEEQQVVCEECKKRGSVAMALI